VIEVVTIDTPSLGDRTYLATDGATASAGLTSPGRQGPGAPR
jgi:hypothetical protein